MTALRTIANEIWDLEIAATHPVTESFGSDVLLFDAADGERYVIKNSFTPAKGRREIEALSRLAAHPHVPDLLDHRLVDDQLYLLIEGLDGSPWTRVAGSPPPLLRSVGAAVRKVHDVPFGSFDGFDTWHELLRSNADRYHDMIEGDDVVRAGRARSMLGRTLGSIPDSTDPVLVQFDLRPGNILVNDGDFVALIDFESARGGHASMDFFKLWQQVAPVVPSAMATIMDGYLAGRHGSAVDETWTRIDRLGRLMRTYSLYHGLAGLAWCHSRDDFSGDFPAINRQLIATALEDASGQPSS